MDRDDVSLKIRTSADGERLTVVRVSEDVPIYIEGKEKGSLGDILYHLDVEKMSKSKKNVVAPDELVDAYGADAVRAYLMFGWRWELGGPWDSQGIEGIIRWLNRVWSLVLEAPRETASSANKAERELQRAMHEAIKAVTHDLDNFSFNTAIARLMEYTNALSKAKSAYWNSDLWKEMVDTLLLLLAPITPHLAEELWARQGNAYSVHEQSWPKWDEAMLVQKTREIPIQVNGKVRGRVTIPTDADETLIREKALSEPNVQRYVEGREIVKVIIPRKKLVSIVVK
jgi:leucyl-tRNA synthetase